MQNVLDLVQKRLNEFDGLNGFEVTMMKQELNWFKDILTNKLEEEKEQIIDAYVKGFDISAEGWNGEYGIKDFNNIKEEIKAEEYYKQTYNKPIL